MIDKKLKLLLVFAHPDDETSACGGIIIKYSRLGHSVDVCTTTNGDKGDLGTGEDVSNCVAFLSSNQASYITGETIHVNGGMYMS